MTEFKYTAKEEKFCLEVATGVDENKKPISQAEAYRRAFNASRMKSATIDVKASEMMAKGKIKVRVDELRAAVAKEAVVDASYVLKRLLEIDQMDVIDIMEDDGSIKSIREWPKIWRQYLSGFELADMFEGKGDDRELVGILKKIKWPDKVKNLELLGKHLQVGAFVEKVDHTSSDGSMTPSKNFTADEYVRAQAKLSGELKGLD
jgi:phage terminase small subunit